MTRREHELILGLRSHAHEVPEHIGKIMREAARAFEARVEDFEFPVLPAPIAPPELGGEHRGFGCGAADQSGARRPKESAEC